MAWHRSRWGLVGIGGVLCLAWYKSTQGFAYIYIHTDGVLCMAWHRSRQGLVYKDRVLSMTWHRSR